MLPSRFKLIMLCLLLLGVLTAGLAWAEPLPEEEGPPPGVTAPSPGAPPGAGPPEGHGLFEGGLGLDAKQRQALQKIHEQYAEKREDYFLNIQKKKLELVELLNKEPLNRKVLEQKMEQIGVVEHKLRSLMLAEFFDVRKILTPNQVRMYTRRMTRMILRQP